MQEVQTEFCKRTFSAAQCGYHNKRHSWVVLLCFVVMTFGVFACSEHAAPSKQNRTPINELTVNPPVKIDSSTWMLASYVLEINKVGTANGAGVEISIRDSAASQPTHVDTLKALSPHCGWQDSANQTVFAFSASNERMDSTTKLSVGAYNSLTNTWYIGAIDWEDFKTDPE